MHRVFLVLVLTVVTVVIIISVDISLYKRKKKSEQYQPFHNPLPKQSSLTNITVYYYVCSTIV